MRFILRIFIIAALTLPTYVSAEGVVKIITVKETGPYKVTVPTSISLNDAVKEAGLIRAHSSIGQANFPELHRKQSSELNVYLLELDYLDDPAKEAVSEMESLGYQPIDMAALLMLACQHPDLNGTFRILALGTKWQPDENTVTHIGKHVPVLVANAKGRSLDMDWQHVINWKKGPYLYAAVRK